MKLMEVLPKKHWRHINELLVRFGQDICRRWGRSEGYVLLARCVLAGGKSERGVDIGISYFRKL